MPFKNAPVVFNDWDKEIPAVAYIFKQQRGFFSRIHFT